ncbi:hypothetical protein KLP28_12415 [Nocardioidaceae bacterium]|nr:hypothetical protein KLP28_12415 [Nocardioidaceae bacterium]
MAPGVRGARDVRGVAGSVAGPAAGLTCGVVAGVASVALYAYDWGLALVAVTCTTALLLTPPGRVRGAAAVGWTLAVLLAARGGPGGDIVVTQDVRSVFLALVGLILLVVAAATWPRNQPDRALSSSP